MKESKLLGPQKKNTPSLAIQIFTVSAFTGDIRIECIQTVQAVRSRILHIYTYSGYYIKYSYNPLKLDTTFTKRSSNVVQIQFSNTGKKTPKGRVTLLVNQ
jgi:hypothetical protein